MRVTATEAKNSFGSLCIHAKREPVLVKKVLVKECDAIWPA